MDIKLSDAALHTIVSKAILEGMGQEQRDLLVQNAIESLFKEANPSNYSDKRTHLEVAYQRAINYTAEKIALEVLERPEFRARVEAVVVEAVNRQFEGDGRESLVQRMADGIGRAFDKLNGY